MVSPSSRFDIRNPQIHLRVGSNAALLAQLARVLPKSLLIGKVKFQFFLSLSVPKGENYFGTEEKKIMIGAQTYELWFETTTEETT